MSSKGVKKKTGGNEAGGVHKKLKTAFYEKQLFGADKVQVIPDI